MGIRLASLEDTNALLNIYNEYIDSNITFETVLPSIDEFGTRIKSISSKYPYLVYEDGGVILGYAYAHQFRERRAYDYDVELSIYISKNATGKGIGTSLYSSLFEILKAMGIRNLYSCITIPNEKSEGIHKSMGFRYIGEFTNSGYKNGKWLSVVWYEKAINDYATPQEIKYINELDIKELLK